MPEFIERLDKLRKPVFIQAIDNDDHIEQFSDLESIAINMAIGKNNEPG